MVMKEPVIVMMIAMLHRHLVLFDASLQCFPMRIFKSNQNGNAHVSLNLNDLK